MVNAAMVRAAAALLIIVAGAACSPQVAGNTLDGGEIFEATCARCHGPAGKPTPAIVAQLGVKDLTTAEFRARATLALVEKQVREGSPNKIMPSFTDVLNEAQIKAVVAYVLAMPTAPAPAK